MVWVQTVQFEKFRLVQERYKVIHKRNISVPTEALTPDVKLMKTAELYVTKTWGRQWARDDVLLPSVQHAVHKLYKIPFEDLRSLFCKS